MRFRVFLGIEGEGREKWSEDRFCCENISCPHYGIRNWFSTMSLVVADGREFCSQVCARLHSDNNGKGET